MQFIYFGQPEHFSIFIDDITICDFCKLETTCFDGSSFIGEDVVKAICPDCLSAGKLSEKKMATCNGDIGQLKKQLKKINKELSAKEIDDIANQKTAQLEHTTPPLISWQDWEWPCADADYCTFIGFGSVSLYERLAGKKDPVTFFSKSIYYNLKDDEEGEILWEDFMPANEIKNYEESTQHATLFYVFKSLRSNKIITIWDSD